MGIDEDYEAWAKDMLTTMDREVTRELLGLPASDEKEQCPTCSRLFVQNRCACGHWDIKCYNCHLKTDHRFIDMPENPR
jgi:ribosomal protein L37AE/L43A